MEARINISTDQQINDAFAFPDIFSVIEGETQSDSSQTFSGFEDRVNQQIEDLL